MLLVSVRKNCLLMLVFSGGRMPHGNQGEEEFPLMLVTSVRKNVPLGWYQCWEKTLLCWWSHWSVKGRMPHYINGQY